MQRKIWEHNGVYSIVEIQGTTIKILYSTFSMKEALEKMNYRKEFLYQ